MSLVKCPECGKEGVSDQSTACPQCGFNLKEYCWENSNRHVKYCSCCAEDNATIGKVNSFVPGYVSWIQDDSVKICKKHEVPYRQLYITNDEFYLLCANECSEEYIEKMNELKISNREMYDKEIELGRKNKEIKLKQEMEQKEHERLESVPLLERPKIAMPIILLIASIAIFLCGMILANNTKDITEGNLLVLVTIIGTAIIMFCVGFCKLCEQIERYHLSNTNPEKYKKLVIQEEDAAEEKEKEQIQQTVNVPKCPTCGSTDVEKIGGVERVASITTFGVYSKKINKTFKCKNCGYQW